MFSLEEGLRLFWLPGLGTLTGRTKQGLAEWIVEKDYLVVSMPSRTEVVLRVLKSEDAIAGYAHDASRMACAAFESFIGLADTSRLPRSCGWTNITAYYGAFFAAHAILRMCGNACFQLEAKQKARIDKVADSFGLLAPGGIETGFYVAHFDAASAEITLRKSAADKKGSHGVLWETFSSELRRFSNSMIGTSALYNKPALFISDLADSLCQKGLNGTWLSNVRNAVNYRHEFGAWFPYKNLAVERKELLAIVAHWQRQPQTIHLKLSEDTLKKHVAVSTAIVSICHLMVNDMRRLGGARSFHSYSSLALTRLAAQIA